MKTIYKSAWLHIQDRKVLFVRSEGKDKFYSLGGKPEVGETAVDALIREVKEEVTVDLRPNSIRELFTFRAQAHGHEDTEVQIACFAADYDGDMTPSNEIVELAWWTSDMVDVATEPGKIILAWLKEQDLID